MRRLKALAVLPALAALLASCTGTAPNIPSLLLALGRNNPSSGNPEMVLVEDNFPNAPRTLTVVPGSEQPLQYSAVASDVVNRAGTPSAMVVVTRDLAGGTAPASRLLTFNLANIDPAAPTAFQQTSTPIQLTGGTSPVFGSTNGPYCFSGVTVSLTGRYVTLLDDPLACGDTTRYPRLYQLDTSITPPTVTPVVLASGVQTTLATVPFDDQASTNETLYFLSFSSGTTYAQVFADPVPHTTATVPANPIASLPSQQQTVLLGNGSKLVAITNQDPYAVNGSVSDIQTVDLATHATTDVATVVGARALAVDPEGITNQSVVAGESQLAVHSSPTAGSPAETTLSYGLTGVAAAIDPINQFAYVVDDNQITVLDLLQVTTCSTPACWYYAFTPVLSLPTNPATNQYVTTLALTRAAP